MIPPSVHLGRRLAPILFFATSLSSFASADILFQDFSSTAGLHLVGDTATAGTALRVTPAESWRTGAAWYSTPQQLVGGFETQFRFRITRTGGIPSAPGADGLAFVIQGMSQTALGGRGGAMGYGSYTCSSLEGIARSVAVEFDTYENGDIGDPNANHVSVQTRGNERNCVDHANSLGATTAIPDLSDGLPHVARIRYVPGQLEVFVDDLVTPALTVPLDLTTYPDLPGGWVGFTAATGSSYENHDILDWSFTEQASGGPFTYCTSAPNSTGGSALLVAGGSVSVQQNDFTLRASGCPAGAFGLFMYGRGAARFPLGDGYLCISPFAPGLFRLAPLVSTDPSGAADMAVDMAVLPPGGGILPGESWNFQFWFRDALPGGSGSNLSSAVRATFEN